MKGKTLGLTAKQAVYIAVFAALTAAGAFIKIPVPVVPFSMMTFFTILAGAVLEKKQAFLSQAVYIVLGLIGVPVFANGGGISYVLQPTFGYILALPFTAYMIAKLDEAGFKTFIAMFLPTLFQLFAGTLYLYLINTLYFGKETDLAKVMTLYAVMFIPVELVKCALAYAVYYRINRFIDK